MSARSSGLDPSPTSVAALLRERDQLFLLHEALAEVERARELEERLSILVHAIERVGFGRVDTLVDYAIPVVKKDYDKTQYFKFGINNQF